MVQQNNKSHQSFIRQARSVKGFSKKSPITFFVIKKLFSFVFNLLLMYKISYYHIYRRKVSVNNYY